MEFLHQKLIVLRNETIIRSLLVKESKSLLNTMNITYPKKNNERLITFATNNCESPTLS